MTEPNENNAYLQELISAHARLLNEKNRLSGSYQTQIDHAKDDLLKTEENPRGERSDIITGRMKNQQRELTSLQKLETERINRLSVIDDDIRTALESIRLYEQHLLDQETNNQQAQRDHEREMAIIANETARENRLAAEAAAKVAATAQEQASQSVDSLLKGLQGDGKT